MEDHLARDKFSKLGPTALISPNCYCIRPTVEQELYYMANGLTHKIHNKIPQNFQRCWGKIEK